MIFEPVAVKKQLKNLCVFSEDIPRKLKKRDCTVNVIRKEEVTNKPRQCNEKGACDGGC